MCKYVEYVTVNRICKEAVATHCDCVGLSVLTPFTGDSGGELE